MPVSNLGWIHPDQRTPYQIEVDQTIQSRMPRFFISGRFDTPKNKQALLYQFIEDFKPFHQQTGSCVGCGLGMALWCLESVEVFQVGELESPVCPFWLLPYGKSREIGGLLGKGEGSFGSAAIEALQKFGTIPYNTPSVPQAKVIDDSLVWGEKAELEWSDGQKIAPKYLTESKKHIIKSSARLHSAEECRASLINGYPITLASNWGGEMNPPVKGNPAILLNKRVTTWGHQMSCLGWVEHEQFGDIFWIQNSWGQSHGTSPGHYEEPAGGFWILASDMDWICRDGEVFSLSNFAGFPAQKIEWYI
jgi:hypothetical protein